MTLQEVQYYCYIIVLFPRGFMSGDESQEKVCLLFLLLRHSKAPSKLDLLVRVRYSNPLPAPPCPPKLIDIPTTPIRYAKPGFLDAIVEDTPLPMIVDAECGMPLDLSKYGCLWEEDADDSGKPCSVCRLGRCLPKVPTSHARNEQI